jgi:hypothetical protein
MDIQLHTLLILSLGGGEWSASLPGRFTPEERAPRTYYMKAWEGPTAPDGD